MITSLGVDPIRFDVLVVLTLEMGLISLPVGVFRNHKDAPRVLIANSNLVCSPLGNMEPLQRTG